MIFPIQTLPEVHRKHLQGALRQGSACLFFYFFIYTTYFWLCWVFVAVWAFSSCSERGLLFIVVRGLLIAVASLVAEHRLWARWLQ